MDSNAPHGQKGIAKLADLIKDIRIAMLTTVEDSGELRSRPMATQEAEFDGVLWFFTKEHSTKVDEVQKERQVNVSFADPKSQTYVSTSGTAIVSTDKAKMKELWQPTLKAWFPEGLDDPELALLRVTIHQAEYWDTPPGLVVNLFGAAKAAVTGKEYQPGDHQKVSLG